MLKLMLEENENECDVRLRGITSKGRLDLFNPTYVHERDNITLALFFSFVTINPSDSNDDTNTKMCL